MRSDIKLCAYGFLSHWRSLYYDELTSELNNKMKEFVLKINEIKWHKNNIIYQWNHEWLTNEFNIKNERGII